MADDNLIPFEEERKARERRAKSALAAYDRLPLMRPAPPPAPFPIEALGNKLGPFAQAIRNKVQAPIEICAQSVLATATVIAQPFADVFLPMEQRRPLSNFFITIAESGERKTTCDNEAMKPVKRQEYDLGIAYEIDFESWRNRHEAWQAQRQKIKRAQKLSLSEREEQLRETGPEPIEPAPPVTVCEEPSLEGLSKLMSRRIISLGLFSSDGGSFVGGYAMREEQRLRTATGLSLFWDGADQKVVRAGAEVTILSGRRLTMHLMVQPSVAFRLLHDGELEKQGLTSRMLFVSPVSAAGSRPFKKPTPEVEAAISEATRMLYDIHKTPIPMSEEQPNRPEPRLLMLSDDAERLWIPFHDDNEERLRKDGQYAEIPGLGSKLPEHAIRLAGVLAIIEDPEAVEIGRETIERGIVLARYYAGEALRLKQSSQADPELQNAEQLSTWLRETWWERSEYVSSPNICQHGPMKLRGAKTVKRLLLVLEDYGHVVKEPEPKEIEGATRRDVWRIVGGEF